jgi:hypothetical protein
MSNLEEINNDFAQLYIGELGAQRADVDRLVAETKEILANPAGRIRVHDLIQGQFATANEELALPSWTFAADADADKFEKRVKGALYSVVPLVAVTTYWGDNATDDVWAPYITEWSRRPTAGGSSIVIELAQYPAAYLFRGQARGARDDPPLSARTLLDR